MASAVYHPLRGPIASAAWKLVMHHGLPVAEVADQLNTTRERVEYMLLAFAHPHGGVSNRRVPMVHAS